MPSTIQPIIVTADIERLLRFYTGLLDAEETTRFPTTVRCSSSGCGSGTPTSVSPPTPTRAMPLASACSISVDVKDVDGLLGQVEALGGRVLGPPNDMPWGQRVAHIQDPDGNAVNLTQNL